MKDEDMLKILYTTKDKDTGELIEEVKEPLILQLKNSSLPDKIKEEIKKMKKEEEKEFMLSKPFGERNKQLINVVPLKQFLSNKISPFPGLSVDLDGKRALVKAVSGGRVVVDFNHPLAGKDLDYKIKLVDIIIENKQKIKELMEIQEIEGEITIENNKADIKLQDKGNKETFVRRKNTLFIALKQFIPELEFRFE